MKLKLFIVILFLTVPIISNCQIDSTARVSKEALAYLIERHHVAVFLAEENNLLRFQNTELSIQIENYKLQIHSYKQDSIMADSILSKEGQISQSWEKSYLTEKSEHEKTKKKWRFRAIVVVVGNVALIVLILL